MYSLLALGRRPWADAARIAEIDRWCWYDLEGAHLEPTVPDDCPPATHLWGWSAGSWVRWRVDTQAPADQVLVGALLSVEPRPGAEEVSVHELEGLTWPSSGPDRNRVSLAPDLRDLTVTTRTVLRPVRLTFVSLGAAT